MTNMIDAPNGYYFAVVDGRSLRHLVKVEVYNSTALCGVETYFDSRMTIQGESTKLCPRCKKLLDVGK